MLNKFGILLLVILVLTITAIAQESTTSPSVPEPTPKPAVKGRTFDQFDLNNGGPLLSSRSSANGYEAPAAVIEPVDQFLFDMINQIDESASFLQEQLAKAVNEHAAISQDSQFGKFFIHRMNGIMALSETHRSGLLGMPAVQSERNKKLLFLVQDAANDIVQVVAITPEGYSQFPEEWNRVSEKYKVPLLDNASNGLRLNKPVLLTSMVKRMNMNLAQLKRQMVVRK